MRHQAIYNTHSNALYIKAEIAYDKNDVQIDLDDTKIQAEVTRLQAEYDAQEYARFRKAEYDALNQFELISDDTNNGTTTHIDAVNAIKTKYPKP